MAGIDPSFDTKTQFTPRYRTFAAGMQIVGTVPRHRDIERFLCRAPTQPRSPNYYRVMTGPSVRMRNLRTIPTYAVPAYTVTKFPVVPHHGFIVRALRCLEVHECTCLPHGRRNPNEPLNDDLSENAESLSMRICAHVYSDSVISRV